MAVLRTFVLREPINRDRAAEFMQQAPAGSVVRVSEPVRDLAINAALHAKLTEIARSRKWCGKRLHIDTWKRLFVYAWGRATGHQPEMLPAIDGHGFDVIWQRTSEMTQAEMRELLSYIEAWENEGDV